MPTGNTYEATLICKRCGHERQYHPENKACRFKWAHFPDGTQCKCDGFQFDPELDPKITVTEDDVDHWMAAPNPIALTAAAAVGHIERGDFDPYLEMILAAAHNRKRALRNVRGFPRYDR